jgi:hypothetical protein
MFSMKKWMLGAAVLAGGLGLGSMQAKAAEFGVYVRGPVAYVPPCPGPGYNWVAGYYANGYWVPGRWNFIGVRGPAPIVRFDAHRDFAYRGFDRRFDRDHFRR